MYIKSVVLDGFKSYAQRTEINGFDPLFNAITGLNGSGKSNILDGICFLLGITNLAHVRAVNLNELVYKNGQGAVTKATVSVTFDNTNKSQSPLGYEHFDEITVSRQIAIGNRNKYMINGIVANNTRVQDLFRSVQLNVNNPQFLIMQGRITKVLNMKPQEILSMIEEATGTRLYENKKENAQKIIEKKNAKIREMDSILNEEIIPKLTKCKEERASYLEYQKIIRELDHLNKLYVAYRYFCCEETKRKTSEEEETLRVDINQCKSSIAGGDKRVKELANLFRELQENRGKEVNANMKVLQAKLEEALKAETVEMSARSAKEGELNSEFGRLQQLEEQLREEQNVLAAKEQQLLKLEDDLKKLHDKNVKDKEAQTGAVQQLQAVKAGLAANLDGKVASMDEQLRAAKISINSAETKFKEIQIRLRHCENELNAKTKTLERNEAGYKVDESKCERMQKDIEKLENEVKQMRYEENSEEKLLEELREVDCRVLKLKERLNNLQARFHQLQFEYQDPEPNFNRRSVKGLVAMLINIKDSKNATALEVVAGGKLYQIVVDTEVTGKKILDRGRLRKRVTIIPLNKISARPIPRDVIQKAESLVGSENVSTALSLVGYDRELEAAMIHVFGTSFVCASMEVARRVTFHESVKRRSVTLAGDSFDPQGLASGGARVQSECILLKLDELRELEKSCAAEVGRQNHLNIRYRDSQQAAARWRDLMQQLDLKRSELQMLTEKLRNSTHGQLLREIEGLKMEIEQLQVGAKEPQEMKEKYTRRAEELEEMMMNKDAVMEREVRRAEAELQTAKNEFESSNLEVKKKEQEHNNLALEIEAFKRERVDLEEQIRKFKEDIEGLRKQMEAQDKQHRAARDKVSECQGRVNEQKELMKGCNKDLEANQRERQEIANNKNTLQLKIDDLQHKISKLDEESKDAIEEFDELVAGNPWIQDEKKFFNLPNTAYDFSERNPTEVTKKIQKLKHVKDKLSKNVNMRAMSMLSQAEEQYNEVSEKRKIVMNDKAKIELMINELDEKKNQAVRAAYTQVNKDFGSIFSTLLPGASAKLIASEGNSILDGLEFKVGFGDVWKESLVELSGGQRSLVALSLILALLLFKPAPLYILDEVDAALDLSHTQNIGQMLKTHFKHSQFVVVSLKDGMFNNANVLFKTKFVDGISTVARYAQGQVDRLPGQEHPHKRKRIV